jgi:hypothetical protein
MAGITGSEPNQLFTFFCFNLVLLSCINDTDDTFFANIKNTEATPVGLTCF